MKESDSTNEAHFVTGVGNCHVTALIPFSLSICVSSELCGTAANFQSTCKETVALAKTTFHGSAACIQLQQDINCEKERETKEKKCKLCPFIYSVYYVLSFCVCIVYTPLGVVYHRQEDIDECVYSLANIPYYHTVYDACLV